MKANPLRCFFIGVIGLTVAGFSWDAKGAPPPFNGSISFFGTPIPNGPLATAAAFTQFTSVFVGGVAGSYTNVPGFATAGWTPFSFDPPALPIVPLWALTNSGVTYSFDATSLVVFSRGTNYLDIQGTGIAHITGFADTPGTLIFAANQNSSSYVFTATVDVNATNMPVLQSVTQTNGTITFAWNALAGQPYQVECITNWTQTHWDNLGGVITTTNSTATASDTIAPHEQRFYRVVLPK